MNTETPAIKTTPKRPYLVRAFYEWIVDNGLTPHVLVNANMDNVQVPQSYIKDGSIVLNLSPGAVHDWFMDNDAISFSARFNGSAFPIYLPMHAVMAIYAQENQDGLSFPEAEYEPKAADSSVQGASEAPEKPAISAVDTTGSVASIASGADAVESETADASDDATSPPKARPTLRVVK